MYFYGVTAVQVGITAISCNNL